MALQKQTYPKNLYEVIVVDNNSTEDIKSVVDQFQQAKHVFEPNPGSYSARNRALSIVKGEILGFTDSDCAPAQNWIEKGVAQMLAHPGCGFIAGRIGFSFQDPNNPTPAELYDSLHFLQQEKYVREGHFGVTANLFTTPQVFEVVGLFDQSLESGGDREWGKRVYAAGYKQVYAESVEIVHPARSSVQELTQKLKRVCEGEFKLKKQAQLPASKFLSEVLLDVKPPVAYLIQLLKDDNIKSVRKRVYVVYIYVYTRLIKAWVKLRLYFT